jgi:hypothetical protein
VLVSVITALKGVDVDIEETAASLPVELGDVEWLIKSDLGFVDQRLAKFARSENVRIIASADRSLYQALNQALAIARGRYFIVLGSGDLLREGSIPRLIETVRTADNQACSVFFPVFMRAHGKVFAARPQLLHTGMTTPHPGAVLVTQNALQIGGFDERYRIASDYDLLCRYIKRWPRAIISDQVIVDFKGGGISDVLSAESSIEAALVRQRNFG